mgnify:FL=1
MPIETTHPEYKAEDWQKMRDCYEGNTAVKEANETYLTRPNGQKQGSYEAMLKRAFFLPVLARTIAEVTGNIMRKDPVIEVPTALQPVVDDVGTGKPLDLFISSCISELLLSSRRGVLVDYQGNQPVLLAYNAENIVNWSDDFIVLREPYYSPDPKDPYSFVLLDAYRELTFDENGYYIQRVWTKKEKQRHYEITEVIQPLAMGEKLDSLPFVWMNPLDNTNTVRKPVFLDLADANLQHYQVYSDLRQVIQGTTHKATFLFADGEAPKEVIYGLGAINHVNDSQARAEVLSDNSGLTEYLNVLDKLETQMAALGARSLQAKRKQVQSGESARIEQSGDSATLTTIASSVESGIEQALEIAARFVGATAEEVIVEVNKDFVDTEINPQMISAMLQALNTGRISENTWLSFLQRGELLPITVEEELEFISDGN